MEEKGKIQKCEKKEKQSRFLGYVKFYDTKKGFGYIASNKKGMHGDKFYRDFYIDNSSWIKLEEKSQYITVIFQIEKQNDGRIRASQVRRTTTSQEDIDFILSYFGEYEIVLNKDKEKRNLITKSGIGMLNICKHVTKIIQEQKNRTPESTFNLFKSLVSRAKIDDRNKKSKYVFDRAYDKDDFRHVWQNLFSSMTKEEKEMVLVNYPSSQQYMDIEVLEKHIDILDLDFDLPNELKETLATRQISQILEGKYIFEVYEDLKSKIKHLPEASQLDFNKKIEDARKLAIDQIVENATKELDEEIIKRFVDHWEYSGNRHPYTWTDPEPFFNAEESRLLANCKNNIKYLRFKNNLLESKIDSNTDITIIDKLLKLYTDIPSERKNELLNDDEIKGLFSIFINTVQSISIKDIKYGELWSDYSSSMVRSAIDRLNKIKDYISGADLSIAQDEVVKHCVATQDGSRLNVLNEKSFITEETYRNAINEIANNLSIDDIVKLLQDGKHSMLRVCLSRIIILFKDKSVLEPLSAIFQKRPNYGWDPFEGEQQETPEEDIVVETNADLLCFIYELIDNLFDNEGLKKQFVEYLKSIKDNDYIRILPYLRYDMIETPKESIVKSIIDRITISDGAIDKNGLWSLSNQLYGKYRLNILFSIPKIRNILIEKILAIDLSSLSNVPYALYWIRLLSWEKPTDEEDYYVKKKWEELFLSDLNSLKTRASSNKRLLVLLWIVYFRTQASLPALTEIFSYIDNESQIRVFRKLMQLIEMGKLSYDIDGLHKLLCPNGEKLCLPLQICMLYLKMRYNNPNATLDEKTMFDLIVNRPDHDNWVGILQLMTKCAGRSYYSYSDGIGWPTSLFYGIVNKIHLVDGSEVLRIQVWDKMVDYTSQPSKYNNKNRKKIEECISITLPQDAFKCYLQMGCTTYDISCIYEKDVRVIAQRYGIYYKEFDYGSVPEMADNGDEPKTFCECRTADNFDRNSGKVFSWCEGKACASILIGFHLSSEWEKYTMLDFMRILKIPFNYTRSNGSCIQYGHYIILSSFLESFKTFYEHLKCRACGKLMNAANISNFAAHNITDFCCTNSECPEKDNIIYLNHCFNKTKCKAIIDSRDSKQCPNDYYICPSCGCCCSTGNVRNIINRHSISGGIVSPRLKYFVENNLGHLEKHEFFCYKCGRKMENINGIYKCAECGTEYKR